MSYPMPGQPPADPPPKQRPAVVTASSWLLFLVAALYVANFVAAVAVVGDVMDAYREVYAGTELEDVAGIAGVTTIAISSIFLLVAAGFATLGILNNLGKNPARITTWVVGGLALCCSGALLALEGVSAAIPVTEEVDGPDPADAQRAIDAALPGWYDTLGWITSIGGILLLIVALVLLALPASNEFFRKAPPSPPLPPPAYPQSG